MQPYRSLLPALLFMAQGLPAWADSVNLPMVASLSVVPSSLPLIEVPEEIAPDMTELGVQIDPIDSPHPIPWNWVLATHAEISANGGFGIRYYRSPSLISPDGQYAAYSRIQMQAHSELYRSRVTSVMFVENLRTGDLRTIKASSPLADNPLVSNQEADMGGTFGIMIPISWSKSGDRILARQFEGVFNTSDASDYAVIWDRQQNRANTIAPDQIQYSSAVLLGWSEIDPDRVLFRTDEMGDEHWSVWAVDLNGQTALATEDNPSIYGQVVHQVWAGPQSRL
ncbi:MAG TPA: hypothetical protein V6D48_06015 [Oculatellaceae cyanobacterium]